MNVTSFQFLSASAHTTWDFSRQQGRWNSVHWFFTRECGVFMLTTVHTSGENRSKERRNMTMFQAPDAGQAALAFYQVHFTPDQANRSLVYVRRIMDDLKQAIGLRAYAQRDPIVEYKKEAYEMFVELIAEINTEIASFSCLLYTSPSPRD